MVSGKFFSCHKMQNFGYGGRATVEAMGLNPANDLNDREYSVNKVCEDNTFEKKLFAFRYLQGVK